MSILQLPNGRFAPGNPGSGVSGLGRASKKELEILAKARQRIIRKIFADQDLLVDTYRKFIKKDPATTRHAVERLIPAARQEIDLRAQVAIVEIGAYDPDEIDVTAEKAGKT